MTTRRNDSLWRTCGWPILLTCVASVVFGSNQPVFAQRKAHYLFNAHQPTGEIGRAQLQLRPQLHGYFQPVRIAVPQGATIEVAESGVFGGAHADVAQVGLQVGYVYRLRISQIPNQGLASVYPTIELLDRMHPPQGKAWRYPIPVEITDEELRLALKGKFVTRVVYVEDPRKALAVRDVPEQRVLEVLPSEDPLAMASELGRPVAILRMGSLTPGPLGPTDEFLFGSPPLQRYAASPTAEYVPDELDADDMPTQVPTEAPLLPPNESPLQEHGVEAGDDATITETQENVLEPDTATPTDSIENDDVFGEEPFETPETEDAESDPFGDF